MALSTQPYKGARDFYPEDMRRQRYIFDVWRRACESFGYEEYDTPVLEPLELYTAKTSEEIVNEQTYSFTDRGDRKVVMRPEMTPSVSRLVAGRRQEFGYPVRLYSIPNCFRYERPQKGRLREFWQLNADIFGVEGLEADAEAISLANAIMIAFGANSDSYEINISSRQFVQDALAEMGLDDGQRANVIRLIDKKEKVTAEDWQKMLGEAIGEKSAAKVLEFLAAETVPENIQTLLSKLQAQGITNARFNKYLARGFDYYTDIVFEVFDTNPDNNRSMFGGGRYDGLVGQFGVEPVPTVGFAVGDAVLQNFLDENGLMPDLKPATKLTVLVAGDVVEGAVQIANQLREKYLNVAIDFSGRKLDKQIKAAEKRSEEYVLFVGQDELTSGQYKLKSLSTGWEDDLGLDGVVDAVNRQL